MRSMTRKVRKLATSIALCGAMMLPGCAGMTTQQGIDMGLGAAKIAHAAAQTYFEARKPEFKPHDAAQFQQYLDGFGLALTTGEGVAGYAQRWFQFLGE